MSEAAVETDTTVIEALDFEIPCAGFGHGVDHKGPAVLIQRFQCPACPQHDDSFACDERRTFFTTRRTIIRCDACDLRHFTWESLTWLPLPGASR